MKNIDKRKHNFIKKSKIIHNNKYNYSLVEYISAHKKVKIICQEHNVFEQTPDSHSRGHGCKICNGGTKSNTEDFIKKSKILYGDTYNYSLVNYVNNHTNVKIICKKHGVFNRIPNDHLYGCGCKICGVEKRSNEKRLNTETFIEKADIKHKKIYDYSLVDYISSKHKINIICKKHGVFPQNCNSHLMGNGCPFCSASKGEIKIRNFFDKNRIKFLTQKTFNDCKNKKTGKKLKFDFYLPKYNVCIEYDGIQHFINSKFFGDKIGFVKRIKSDKIKNNYCLRKGKPKLIRISYKKFDKIENILSKKLYIK